MIMKLNLGCSGQVMAGFEIVNVDIRDLPGVDVIYDLERTPWPWPDRSVDEVFAAHVLEHLRNPIAAMQEIHRVLKPGGKVTVIVPNAAGYMAHYPGHKSLFSEAWFHAFVNCDDNQDDWSWMFTDVRIELRLFHHALKWGLVCGCLKRSWERFWNVSRMRQMIWETLGVMVAGEVWFTAMKANT